MDVIFHPFISQLTEDPKFGYLLPNGLAIAALGCNEKAIRQLRESSLVEGTHYLQEKSVPKRIWFTFVGLIELTHLVNSERSKNFRDALLKFSSNQSAIVRSAPSPIVTHNPQPVSIHPVQPEIPYPVSGTDSGAMAITPQLAAEIIQLKRDEIELRRSELETERMRLYRSSSQPPTNTAAPTTPNLPVTPTETHSAVDSQLPTGLHIHIENHSSSEGGSRYDNGLGEAFVLACAIALFSALGFSLLITSTHHQEVPGYVR